MANKKVTHVYTLTLTSKPDSTNFGPIEGWHDVALRNLRNTLWLADVTLTPVETVTEEEKPVTEYKTVVTRIPYVA